MTRTEKVIVGIIVGVIITITGGLGLYQPFMTRTEKVIVGIIVGVIITIL